MKTKILFIISALLFSFASNAQFEVTYLDEPATPNPSEQNDCPTVITHNTEQFIFAAINCPENDATGHSSFYRDYDLSGFFGVENDFQVMQVEFGVGILDLVEDTFPVKVHIYSTTKNFPPETQDDIDAFTLLASETVEVTSEDEGMVVSVPISALIPSGHLMVFRVEVLPDDTSMFNIGGNLDAETGISWGQGHPPFCGDDSIIPVSNHLHLVMNVCGEEIVLGVDDNSLSNVNIFPNPTKDKVSITGIDISEIKKLVVYDILGKEVIDGMHTLSSSNDINVSSLDNGIYLLVIENLAGDTVTRKIIKE